jgi:tetratricopeptide (TPR) repeat protein
MSASTELQILHCPEQGPHSFRLWRGEGLSPIVRLPSPFDQPVSGLPDSNLMRELRWYLEEFLDYPFPPETGRAERLLAALRDWGQTAFRMLTDGALSADNLAVVADNPHVFAWPWEALADESGRWLSETRGIERRPGQPVTGTGLSDQLARDRVRILLVIARSGEQDVRFGSLARPVVELIERERLPAEVEVLRPPTFRRLQRHLEEQNRAGRPYHLVHFDGHGHWGPYPGPGRREGRKTGWLLFEDATGQPDWIDAERFSEALQEQGVPAVVLNACQSALIDAEADDPSASVAHALLRAGVRAVVAMSYSVYVSAARAFLPAFYRQLFATGRLTDAVRAGRRELHDRPGRVCARGTFPLRDALVPVVYQQGELTFAFASQAPREQAAPSRLPEEARDGAAGFVGRDGPILQLERALRGPRPAVLIQGMGGQGKTTLAKGFLRWLEQTGGLGEGVFWFSFEGCRNAEAFVNRLGERLFGPDFARQRWEERRQQVTAECRKRHLRIVWDNFESVRGVPGTSVSGLLPDEDAAVLRQFVFDLDGGRTRVLITSRSREDWLDPEPESGQPPALWRLRSLGGLDGEERWEFADALLEAQRLTAHREDVNFGELMGALGGHPLSMRVMLPKLKDRPAAELLKALRANVEALRSPDADEAEVRLFATLRLATDELPESWRPLLVGLALHEGFVDGDYLVEIATQVDGGCTRETVNGFLATLALGGLLRDHGQAVFEMHPALSGYLRTALGDEGRGAWLQAFADVMGSVANAVAPLPAHEQRSVVHWHLANFQAARQAAHELALHDRYAALTQALAVFAQHRRDYRTAAVLYRVLIDHHLQRGHETRAAGAYHQLGRVAEEERDFDGARDCYLRSIAIKEKERNEYEAASSYHQLGTVAQKQGDFTAARNWYLKSVAISERLGPELQAAATYHELGLLAQKEGDWTAAREFYLKSLTINLKQGNKYHAAMTYHNLGTLAQEQRDLDSAREWYLKSLALNTTAQGKAWRGMQQIPKRRGDVQEARP